MQVIRPVGRDSAAKKYDLLSAMMAYALAGDQNRQRLVLRLISLITTRYNWQRNELATGQREIARLWCVNDRTVKRDMARLRAMGWVTVKRQGARGRVSVLGLDFERIMLDTRPMWDHIGEDFVRRVGGEAEPVDRTVVPFRKQSSPAVTEIWGRAKELLAQEDPAIFDAWFAALADIGAGEGALALAAPSRFHAAYVGTHLMARLRVAVSRVDPSISVVRIEVLPVGR